MKRLIKKENMETREYLIPITPIYNPMGKGENESEFSKTDNKSYQKMLNQHTLQLIEEREKKDK